MPRSRGGCRDHLEHLLDRGREAQVRVGSGEVVAVRERAGEPAVEIDGTTAHAGRGPAGPRDRGTAGPEQNEVGVRGALASQHPEHIHVEPLNGRAVDDGEPVSAHAGVYGGDRQHRLRIGAGGRQSGCHQAQTDRDDRCHRTHRTAHVRLPSHAPSSRDLRPLSRPPAAASAAPA